MPLRLSSTRAGVLVASLLLCVLGLAVPVWADIKLSVDVDSGAKIADVYTLKATASFDNGIAKVEFRVDNKLRASVVGTPYNFVWDTIDDPEGAHDVLVTAYDTGGRSKSLDISLVIDNDPGKGAETYVKQAEDANKAGNPDEAYRLLRRAVKADPNDLNAVGAMGDQYASLRDWAKAIALMAKAKGADADPISLTRLASYHFSLGLRPENVADLSTELDTSVTLHRKVADILIDRTRGSAGPEGHEAVGDALLAAGKTGDALLEYKALGVGEGTPIADLNRYALTLVETGNVRDRDELFRAIDRRGLTDSATRSINALSLYWAHQFAQARAIVVRDLPSGTPSALIVAAFADAAMGKRATGYAEARQAVKRLPNSAEARFALAVTTSNVDEELASLRRAMTLAPLQPGPYVQFAAHLALEKNVTNERVFQAQAIGVTAEKLDTESGAAPLFVALMAIRGDQPETSEPLLAAAYKADPNALDVLSITALYYRATKQMSKSDALMATLREKYAEVSDKYSDNDTAPSLLYRLYIGAPYRPDLFLTPATLYPK